jgi:hypothetical protein
MHGAQRLKLAAVSRAKPIKPGNAESDASHAGLRQIS